MSLKYDDAFTVGSHDLSVGSNDFLAFFRIREVSFFTVRGGLLKIGGIRYFFLDQKGITYIF